MIGEKFNFLTYIGESSRRFANGSKYAWFMCDCGVKKEMRAVDVFNGRNKSCGCFSKIRNTEIHSTHKLSKTKTYRTWNSMIQRCINKKNSAYKNYGGRGIFVCDEWFVFENFVKDMGIRPDGKSIDRINNDDGYYKENCRWADNYEQSINKRINSNNSSSVCGVSFHKKRRQWRAYIMRKGKRHYLGWFLDFDKAVDFRSLAEEMLK